MEKKNDHFQARRSCCFNTTISGPSKDIYKHGNGAVLTILLREQYSFLLRFYSCVFKKIHCFFLSELSHVLRCSSFQRLRKTVNHKKH